MQQDEKKYLSKVIDFDTDIAPYQFIKIFSGVGSGKNRFVDHLVRGGVFKHADGTDVKNQNVLLITSRRAKTNEQLNSDKAVYDPKIGVFDSAGHDWLSRESKYENYYESKQRTLPDLDGWGARNIYERSCVMTNAGIEHELKENYTRNSAGSHPWERFDMIIVDEIHAVLADASYQSAPYYVRRLIEETLQRPAKCKVIVMTGSPEILENYPLFDRAHEINKMDVCVNVKPNKVEFISKEQAKELQLTMIRDSTPFVAFFNHIGAIYERVEQAGVEQWSKIAVSFSDEKRRKELAKNKKVLYENMDQAETALAETQKIPQPFTAFLTTAKNKEGINIENEEFRYMFVEAHNRVDVVQMAGRLRNAVDTLYVVADAAEHADLDNRFEQPFTQNSGMLATVNRDFEKQCEAAEVNPYDEAEDAWITPVCRTKDLRDYISFIQDKFPYILYDYFTNRFVYYAERKQSIDYYKQQKERFAQALQSAETLRTLAEEWFPGVPCVIAAELMVASLVEKYLGENHWLNEEREIRDAERQEILKAVCAITGEDPTKKKLRPLLAKYGYDFQTYGKKKNSRSVITKIQEE